MKRWEGRSVTPEQVTAAAQYLEGKRNVDILKMAEATGMSVGLAKHLNEARKEHYRSQGGSSGPVHKSISESFFKQKHIGLIKRK